MAFPVSESRTAARTTNGTSWTLTGLVPAHASGDVLLLAIGVDGVPTLTPDPVGGVAWTNITNTGNVDNKLAIWWLRATSNQAADADLVVASSVTEQGVARCWRLQGVHSTTAPAVGTAAVATSSVPNPPLLNPAGWDVEDTWWLALVNTDGAVTATAYPANMDTATGFSDTSGGGTGAGLHTCRLESAVASLDPGTFTISGSETWVAQTVAIRPAQHIGSLAATQAGDTLAAAGTVEAGGGSEGALAVTQAADTLAATGTVTEPPVTVLTQGSNATDATSFATASVTPAANAVVWLAAAIRHATLQPSTPTVSGCGLTWASVGEIYFDESTTRTKLFVFRGTAAAPSAGAITMNVGTTHGGAVWQVIQAVDVNNPSSPVVQSVAADSAEALNTGLTLTLPGAVTSGNRVIAFLALFDNTAAQVTEEAGYIDLGMAGPEAGESNLGVTTMWRPDGEQTPSWTWATSALNGGVAVEFAPVGAGVSGALAATQQADTLAASGVLRYTGALSVAQAGDSLAASGTATAPGVSGTLAQTQAADTLAASGVLRYAGTLAAAQGGDTLAASGTVSGVATYVRVSQVYLQAPAGAEGTTGTLAATQAAQTLTAAGILRYTGTLAVTQAAQTLAAAGGTAQNIGALAVTQANQTLAAAGILRYTGTLAVTQASQTLSAVGVLRYTGTLGQTQAGQTLAAAGTVTSLGIAGSLAVTQANQTLAATGVLRYTGTLAQTQASQTLAASGWIRVTGTLAVTQAAQTLSAAGGTAQHIGVLAVTQANQTLAASGQLRYTGALTATQAAQTLAASGTAAAPTVTGTLTATQANQTLAASGTVTIIGIAGNLSVTQANQTLAAVGVLPGYIAFGVNARGRSSGPNGRGATTPGGEARGRSLVGVNAR